MRRESNRFAAWWLALAVLAAAALLSPAAASAHKYPLEPGTYHARVSEHTSFKFDLDPHLNHSGDFDHFEMHRWFEIHRGEENHFTSFAARPHQNKSGTWRFLVDCPDHALCSFIAGYWKDRDTLKGIWVNKSNEEHPFVAHPTESG
jgi:hypothetical protein